MWAFLLSLLAKLPGLLAGPVSQFITGISISAVLGGSGKFFGSVFNNLKTYWRYYLPALLIGAQLATCYGWYSGHNSLLKEKAAHQLDITNFKNAQITATKQAEAEKSLLNKESKANADQADASYSTLYAQYRSVLLRYRSGESATSSTDHNQLPSTPSSNGPGASTEVPSGAISISLDDANVCAINTARLQAVHDWAINQPKDDSQ